MMLQNIGLCAGEPGEDCLENSLRLAEKIIEES